MRRRLARFVAVLVLASVPGLAAAPVVRAQSPQDVVDQAEADFTAGKIAESVADYDRLKELVPSVAPVLWQRGIGLYELGRYDECAAQFVAYHTANPSDLDSVTWHFLCVARGQSPERARAGMLQGGHDSRVMRTEIHEMLAGRMSPEDVLAEANDSGPLAQFYAHIYIGFYLEAIGDRRAAFPHFTEAASDQYQADAGFMSVVARIHLANVQRIMQALPAAK